MSHDPEDRFDLTTSRDGDHQTLTIELDVDAAPDEVWRALTDAEELMRWFPLQARVEPGVGGSIWMSWDGSWSDSQPIEVWEPGRRLQTAWPLPAPQGSSPEGKEAGPLSVLTYEIAARDGGGATLHVVHSGFPTGDDWDDIFDSHRRGWGFELRSLQHYLRHHPGKPRRIARVRRAVSPLDETAVWTLLWSPEGLLAADGQGVQNYSAPERGPYALTLTSGHRLEGRAMVVEPPTDLGATVASIDGVSDAESSLLRVSIESWCGPDGSTELHLWLATWGIASEPVAAIQTSWEQMVDRMLAKGRQQTKKAIA